MTYYKFTNNTFSIQGQRAISKPIPATIDLRAMYLDVSTAFGANEAKVFDKCRATEEKVARWAIWTILHSHGYNKSAMGRMIGGHDHATVNYGLSEFEKLVQTDSTISEKWDKVKNYREPSTPTNTYNASDWQ